MPKSKNKKDHKKRLNQRKNRMLLESKQIDNHSKKIYLEFLKEEKQKGEKMEVTAISPLATPNIDLRDGPML